jgi:hypothetical protein
LIDLANIEQKSIEMMRTYIPLLGAVFLLFLGNYHFSPAAWQPVTETAAWQPVTETRTAQAVTKTRTQVPRKSSVSFVFFVGLEGTGHHLMKTMINSSPDVARINELNIQKLQDSLKRMPIAI